MRRVIRAVSLVGATVGVGIALTATPASAHINDISCAIGTGDSTVTARCFHPAGSWANSHSYRAWAYCTDSRVHTGSWFKFNSGTWSTANCGVNNFVISRGVDVTPVP
jgi:hypothetical protein